MDEPLFSSWAVSWRRHGRQYLIDTDSPEFAHVTAVRLEEQDDAVAKAMKEAAG